MRMARIGEKELSLDPLLIRRESNLVGGMERWLGVCGWGKEKDRNNSATKIPMYRSTPCRRSSATVIFFELSVFQIVG